MRSQAISCENECFEDEGGAQFDYGSVSLPVAKFLRGQADRIRRQCATSIIQIGKALLEAKRHLSHGGFLRWVECEVGIPVRTAQAYMRVANWTLGKSASVAHLSPSALHLLSAGGVPEAFVADILRRTEAGERIPPSVLRAELKAFNSNEEKRFGVDSSSAQPASQSNMNLLSESEALGAMAELVAILAQALSPSDFARVRQLATSEIVLSDPQLPIALERAFNWVAQDYAGPS